MDEEMQLDRLEVGDSFEFTAQEATFTVRRSRQNFYVLGASNAPTRARSGDIAKIARDIDFCKNKGMLPRPTSPRW